MSYHGMVNSTQAYVQDVDTYLQDFLRNKISQLSDISSEAQGLAENILEIALGGKRMRAKLCYLGYEYAGGANYQAIVAAGAAIEMFQTAALIHDDIIDNSESRRGKPTLHTTYSASHRTNNLEGDTEDYGQAAAILGGDLCLSFSEEIFAHAISQLQGTQKARTIFDTMRFEVMAGQFMDIHEETAYREPHELDAFERAFRVLTYKSAKYSVEHPLAIGAALAGAPESEIKKLSAFGLPLGQAFQLRDDMLGVFGDPKITGKPAGDDISEGKRTVLVAYALEKCSPEETDYLNNTLGTELTEEQTKKIQKILQSSQATSRVEELIEALSNQAITALSRLEGNKNIVQQLQEIAHKLTQREA